MIRTKQPPDPSRGGTRGFLVWVREKVLEIFDKTESYALAPDNVRCSSASVQRWEYRLLPYRIVGGRPKNNPTGKYQLFLSICLCLYPNALADGICLCVLENDGGCYSRHDITHRCFEICLTMTNLSR